MTNDHALMDISPPPRPGETHPTCPVCNKPLGHDGEGYVTRRDGSVICWTHFLIEVSTRSTGTRHATRLYTGASAVARTEATFNPGETE